uniref:Uncharacterized protein n=1 Tax=Utricularia reniformis TaxID=192314 RepID=A0A1Y0B3Y1_9LAMI|nr:hypothetical protein AEK19_MT2004 [Utricularia reniformis]ART32165.1 hypothetical protein AEK19_MT2004 [Utricularia reniformis]
MNAASTTKGKQDLERIDPFRFGPSRIEQHPKGRPHLPRKTRIPQDRDSHKYAWLRAKQRLELLVFGIGKVNARAALIASHVNCDKDFTTSPSKRSRYYKRSNTDCHLCLLSRVVKVLCSSEVIKERRFM